MSGVSFDAVGGYRPERKVFWRNQFKPEFTAELKRKSEAKETSVVAINAIELLGMILTCWVVQMILEKTPRQPGQTVLMRGDNMAAPGQTGAEGRGTDALGC